MKVIWYEKGTNVENQVVYQSESKAADIHVEQLNNVLLIRDKDRIVKCIFDVTESKYKASISDLPALPKINVFIKDSFVVDSGRITKSLHIVGGAKRQPWENLNTVRNADYDIKNTMNNFRDPSVLFGGTLGQTFMKGIEYSQEDLDSYKAIIAGKYKLLTEKKKKYYAGYVFLSYAFELFDGSITKPTPPRMFLLGDEYNKNMFWIYNINGDDDSFKDISFDGFLNNYHVAVGDLNVAESKLKVSQIVVSFNENSLNYDKDIIKSIVVYCSKPLSVYDWENLEVEYLHFVLGRSFDGDTDDHPVPNGQTEYVEDDSDVTYNGFEGRYNFRMDSDFDTEGLVPLRFTEAVVNSIVLYRAEKFYVGETRDLIRILDLSSIQSNENISVDASGWWNTSGEMFVYNQRLHLFNYRQEFMNDANNAISWAWKNQLETEYHFFGAISSKPNVIIKTESNYINILMGNLLVLYEFVDDTFYIKLPKYIAFPDNRAERIDFYVKYNGRIYKGSQNLVSSKIMNVAYSVNMNNDDKYCILDCVEVSEEDIPTTSNTVYYNTNNIIVSELSNPFYFPVSQSYQAGGSIVQLAVAHEEITSSQVGQFPLYVFTEERIFALEAGSGDVLYGNVAPVSAEVCINKNVLQTKLGILFVAASGLKVISGRTIVDISDVVEKNLDRNVRIQQGASPSPYEQALSNSALVMLYNRLSAVVFDEYLKESIFGYDINNNEIIISNGKYDYSYVYEINNRIWHKITEVFDMFSYGIGLTKADAGGKRNVADIRVETGDWADVLVQTRPMKLDSYAFKAIRRMAVRGEINPAKGTLFGFYSFGSDNLRNYRMTSAKQCGGYFGVLFNERTRQWHRYFVILCAGKISMDSSISHFEIEGEEKINTRDR
ncbi:MAG: hypothetical protein LBP85_08505 [Prevotellaceae bacterium]|jgi:hypothetical protein|nr:hypothetical protein [Prevotellaceae bacterium]